MQLSYNVFKANVIDKKKVVTPPSIEPKIFSYQQTSNEVDIEKIFENIKSEAKFEAEKIIDDAKKRAQEILKNAQDASKQFIEEAKNKGYEAGYKQGLVNGFNEGINNAQNEAKKIIENANIYMFNSQNDVKEFFDKSKNEIINLSIEIAKDILKKELSINHEMVVNLAEQVISKSKEKKNLILKCSIEDYKILKKRQDDLAVFTDSQNNILIIADADLKNGDIILESTTGLIDATLETRLMQMCNNLLKD